MNRMRRAILSVFNKQGLAELARGLRAQGVELYSSGGTAKYLRDLGLEVIAIADYTRAEEILDGRVKTLHPMIFGGILARDIPEHHGQLEQQAIRTFDLVVVNLYAFEQMASKPEASHDECVEMIDVGGPALIRAAAKNSERVTVVVDPADYETLLAEMSSSGGAVSDATRLRLAARAFAHTCRYDAAIAGYFARHAGLSERFPADLVLPLERTRTLRYGENPHQQAALYRDPTSAQRPAITDCEALQGKELSYNNILDIDAALNLVLDLPGTAACIIKHTNPCGAGLSRAGSLLEAFRRARATDPVSAFGGIVGCSHSVTAELAEELKETFFEVVLAPDFEPAALEILAAKGKLRLVRYPGRAVQRAGRQLRSVTGGMLIQESDATVEDLQQARVVTQRHPTAEELCALDLAWRICKHVKSNAIVFARDEQLLGVGAGQMSRVDSVELAARKAQLPLQGSVVASDAFFPFRDGLDAAFRAGAMAVAQPGGSIRDAEVIRAADEHGMAMIFTGVRHFRH